MQIKDLDLEQRVEPLTSEITSRVRDRHTRRIDYGSKTAVVVYGDRNGRMPTKDFKPLEAQLKKVKALLEHISSPNASWNYAVETLNDLKKYATSIFDERSLYIQFLNDVGSIIQQQLPVHVTLIEKDRIPTGYSINRYR